MNRDQVIDILSMIASYDLRTVGESDVAAWSAAIGDLPFDLAREAVVIHHKTNSERIKPAHLQTLTRGLRQDIAQREDVDARAARDDARDAKLGLERGRTSWAGLPIAADGNPVSGAYAVNSAISIDCPRCKSVAGQHCWNPITEKDRRIPCLERIKAGKGG